MPCPIRSFVLFMLLLSALANGAEQQQAHWTQSYDAGHEDLKGAYAGGSEIMHIVSHKGKLYASNGYWVDAHWVIPPDGQKQSAQVLRLDSLAGKWQVDLDMGQSNDRGLAYMKGNILKSVTFIPRRFRQTPTSSRRKLVESWRRARTSSGEAQFPAGRETTKKTPGHTPW